MKCLHESVAKPYLCPRCHRLGGRQGAGDVWAVMALGCMGLGLPLSARRLHEVLHGAPWLPDSTAVTSECQCPRRTAWPGWHFHRLASAVTWHPLRCLIREGSDAGLPDSKGGLTSLTNWWVFVSLTEWKWPGRWIYWEDRLWTIQPAIWLYLYEQFQTM